MRKQTTVKKTTAKAAKTRGKKPQAAKKKSLRKPAREKTVLTKIKDGLDETVARLKMLLPGETKSDRSHNSGTEMA